MSTARKEQIVLPALRGIMGDWIYYSCLMNLDELSKRVNFAKEIHNSKRLSDMIQRQLKGDRSSQIAEYLKSQKERFFNSLVIATYKGQPNWHAISSIRQKGKGHELNDLDEETVESVGFLTLHGDEQLFALDGQHRLAGIKKAIDAGLRQDPLDEVSVIFVAHEATKKGLQRTRRLFTTLNKTARPVSKGDIIALDEDDVMAICVRRLIEETDLFVGERIAFVASNNMPVKNTSSLTTIGNLYDVLGILFTSSKWDLKKAKALLLRSRPDDKILNKYFNYAQDYFTLLRENFAELEAFFSSRSAETIVKKHRGSHGGKVLFRPIGLEILTRVITRLTSAVSLQAAVELAAKLPRDLASPPYTGLMWESGKKTITNAHKATLREILLYMLGDYAKWNDNTLLTRYRREAGDNAITLPRRVV
jgi:DNA sulfur modification protein DndB